MRAKNIILCLRIAFLASLAGSLTACSRTSAEDELPPIVYMCPMLKDAAVLEDAPGKCPECGMELKPVRIVTAYSCLSNTAFIQEAPGKCVTDGSDLVPITASMFWSCPSSPDKHELEPGKCIDGTDRIKKFEPRLHGDHNPRHGGQFFMADDAWHHIEGTYPSAGLLRVFFYDDWTRPLAPEAFTARAIVKDSAGKELATIPLKAGQISNVMEATIPNPSLPLIATLRVSFKAGEPEKFFDFTFKEYSKEPVAPNPITTKAAEPAPPAPLSAVAGPEPVVSTAVAPAPSDRPSQAAGQTPGQAESQPTSVAPPVAMDLSTPIPFQQDPIPGAARDVLSELTAQSAELASRIEQGAPLGQLWRPALQTKNLALALVNDHLSEIPAGRRAAAENAANRVLRSAYAIDNFGDLGDRGKILAAHEEFVSAVNDLRAAYASIH